MITVTFENGARIQLPRLNTPPIKWQSDPDAPAKVNIHFLKTFDEWTRYYLDGKAEGSWESVSQNEGVNLISFIERKMDWIKFTWKVE